MSVLDAIIEGVREDLAKRRKPLSQLHEEMSQASPVLDAHRALSGDEIKVIAEVKRSSPSKGMLSDISDPAALAEKYQDAGASVISVLTEERRFRGSLADLDAVRSRIDIPILRKDFMVDPYQIIEAKAHGAEVILLIAACLTPSEVKHLAAVAKDTGLEVLLEIHSKEELDHVCDNVDMVGINNRNLKTFEVDLAHSIALAKMLPAHLPKIAESGISDVSTIIQLKKEGFDGFLMGEYFMKQENPAKAFEAFTQLI